MPPDITVVLTTSRPNFDAMLHMPNVDHLRRTLNSLAKQTDAPSFEVVIADGLFGTAHRSPIDPCELDVYHVPVESPWLAKGYPTIAATRNSGAAYANGELIVFVDDCAWLPPDTLLKYWLWYKRNRFAHALHICTRNDAEAARDARFALFTGNQSWLFNFGGAGYASVSLEAFLKLNGYDEAFDGSRQLEDCDFANRCRTAGYTLVLPHDLVVYEEEHGAALTPLGITHKSTPRCNGPWIWWRMEKYPSEYRANDRDYTAEERGNMRPCIYLDGVKCMHVGSTCNMWKGAVGDRHTHADLPDEFMQNRIFDLSARRRVNLIEKHRYRL